MSEHKYIIKNCPAFMKPSYCKNKCSYSIANKRDGELTYKFEFDEDSKCADCPDCVLKQIVERCKKAIKDCDKCKGDPETDCYDCTQGGKAIQSDKILELLDIQEMR